MNYKDAETDSGKYVGNIYTTKNGYSGSGLNCPKGTRLYRNTNCPIFFMPEDRQKGETFKLITPDIAEGVMPYYAISNYGRVENIFTRKVMKENFRPNGYGYYCLAADNEKFGQKKYSTHRLVMNAFRPIPNPEEMQVNHINGITSDNYVDKVMEDGSIQDNLEWVTPKENIKHAYKNNLRSADAKLVGGDAKTIRDYRDQGYSFNYIQSNFYPEVSVAAIQAICNNKLFPDPNYTPKSFEDIANLNPANVHRLTPNDVKKIRELYANGLKYEQIVAQYYPNFSVATISDIIRKKHHNNQ